jgi:hypothetical protein
MQITPSSGLFVSTWCSSSKYIHALSRILSYQRHLSVEAPLNVLKSCRQTPASSGQSESTFRRCRPLRFLRRRLASFPSSIEFDCANSCLHSSFAHVVPMTSVYQTNIVPLPSMRYCTVPALWSILVIEAGHSAPNLARAATSRRHARLVAH